MIGGMRKVSTQIRMPEELHQQLERIAKGQYRSLNSLMVQLLAEAANRLAEQGAGTRKERAETEDRP
jgi:predicted transcriptional regulator